MGLEGEFNINHFVLLVIDFSKDAIVNLKLFSALVFTNIGIPSARITIWGWKFFAPSPIVSQCGHPVKFQKHKGYISSTVTQPSRGFFLKKLIGGGGGS